MPVAPLMCQQLFQNKEGMAWLVDIRQPLFERMQMAWIDRVAYILQLPFEPMEGTEGW